MTQNFRILTAITPDKVHLRAAIWEPPAGVAPRGICVLLHGFAEFLEKYAEVGDELTARGFTVVSFEWRSQGASERSRAGNRAIHVPSFDSYDRDLAAVMRQIVDPMLHDKPLHVIGLAHSMGAHILLRFLHEHPRRFVCGVLLAPMLEVDTGKYSPAMTDAITTFMNLRGPSTQFVFGTEDRDPLNAPFEGNALTSDRERFERTKALLNQQRYLRVFGPTFGWLGAALRSIRQITRRRFPEGIAAPLLVFGAGRDRVVKTAPIRDYAKRLPQARYVEIEEAEHEILMEKDPIRARFWTEFDAFAEATLSSIPPFALRVPAPVVVKPIRGFGAPAKKK